MTHRPARRASTATARRPAPLRAALLLAPLLLAACTGPVATTASATCQAASDCAMVLGPCQQAACSGGRCVLASLPAGSSANSQTSGDCLRLSCDAAGQVSSVPDDGDRPAAAGQCVVGACTAGVASQVPVAAGLPCTDTEGTHCNGLGACVK